MLESSIVDRILTQGESDDSETLSDTPIQITTVLPGQTPLHQDGVVDGSNITPAKVGFIVLNDNPSAVFVHDGIESSLERGTLVIFDGQTPHQTKVDSGVVNLAGPFEVRRGLSAVTGFSFTFCEDSDDCEAALGAGAYTCICHDTGTHSLLPEPSFGIGGGRRNLDRTSSSGTRIRGRHDRRRLSRSGKGSCGKGSSSEDAEPNGVCTTCANAEILCSDCPRLGTLGETRCCEDANLPTVERVCDCDLDYRSCETDCSFSGPPAGGPAFFLKEKHVVQMKESWKNVHRVWTFSVRNVKNVLFFRNLKTSLVAMQKILNRNQSLGHVVQAQ